MSQPPYGAPQWQPPQPNGYNYPPPQPYQQPPVYQQQTMLVQMGGPHRAVTRPKTSVFDIIMLICTCGMWWPVVAAKKRRRTTVTRYQY